MSSANIELAQLHLLVVGEIFGIWRHATDVILQVEFHEKSLGIGMEMVLLTCRLLMEEKKRFFLAKQDGAWRSMLFPIRPLVNL